MVYSIKTTRILARFSLFAAALIWGSSFFVLKESVDVLPVAFVLAMRFTIASAILALIFLKHFKRLTRTYIWQSCLVAVTLYGGYLVQTYGLVETTPGKNAFLTASYCIIVPFLFWAVNHTKPSRHNIAAALLCICGIGLVTLQGTIYVTRGDALTLLSGFCYAMQIVLLAMYTPDKDPILFTITELLFTCAFLWITAFLTDSIPSAIPQNMIPKIVYLAVFCTAAAMLLQNIGQKYTKPSAASIILSLEAVFGIIFSMIFYGERITGQLAVGFSLIFAAVVLSQTEKHQKKSDEAIKK